MKISKESGFTSHELMFVGFFFAVVTCWVLGIIVLCAGNQWATSRGVEDALRLTYGETGRVAIVQRNFFRRTKVVVERDGRLKKYELDSNLLFDYSLKPAE